MTTLFLFMIPISIALSLFFLIAFYWANNNGEFDDLESPAHRMLFDSNSINEITNINKHTEKGNQHDRFPNKLK